MQGEGERAPRWNSLNEMEPTDTISIIFVARRIINDDSLSLYIGIQQVTLSF